jgi:hypothetical protein
MEADRRQLPGCSWVDTDWCRLHTCSRGAGWHRRMACGRTEIGCRRLLGDLPLGRFGLHQGQFEFLGQAVDLSLAPGHEFPDHLAGDRVGRADVHPFVAPEREVSHV